MRFSKSIETQLTLAANAADRSNRPRMLVIAPALLLLGALILTLVIFQRFSTAKSVLSSRMMERERVVSIIDFAGKLEAAHPDPAKLFPINEYMDVNISDVAKDIWPDATNVTVGPKEKRSLGLNKQFIRSEVGISFTPTVAIDDVFRFIHGVLTHKDLNGVFVGKVDLHPIPAGGGWIGSVRFSLYERAR